MFAMFSNIGYQEIVIILVAVFVVLLLWRFLGR